MTDEQINAAIHEALGKPLGCIRCLDPNCPYNQGLNYCADQNAMSEAEWRLTQDQMSAYCKLLLSKGPGSWRKFNPSARQRAEAFVRSLGKWGEVMK